MSSRRLIKSCAGPGAGTKGSVPRPPGQEIVEVGAIAQGDGATMQGQDQGCTLRRFGHMPDQQDFSPSRGTPVALRRSSQSSSSDGCRHNMSMPDWVA